MELAIGSIEHDELSALNIYAQLENTVSIINNVLSSDPAPTEAIQALAFLGRDLDVIVKAYSRTFWNARHNLFGADERNRREEFVDLVDEVIQ